ncbi:MAG: diadenylate cyclase CdaA [Paludibacteraceae bacterium]|nr:diadenylate cyclase CdaA [Paludibacteraceae bacterium]MBQ9705743.1 diadenylate cyclase CdaA [Paludibacteraceae bacterium]
MGFQIGIKDIIDIFFVAIILYEMYRLLRRSGAANVFWGLLAFILVWFLVSYVLNLELTGALFDRIISVGAIALIVIFQDEIRSFFSRLGSRFSLDAIHRSLHTNRQRQREEKNVMQIVLACKKMAAQKTGALIVITRGQDLRTYAESGESLDAQISARLIENIFFKNTPLHDGALIITGGRIRSAACILPVSKNQNIPQHYGLRHRAALGIAEKTDALAIAVSEETGSITVAEGETLRPVKIDELEQLLSREMGNN